MQLVNEARKIDRAAAVGASGLLALLLCCDPLTDYAQAVRETEAGRGDGVQAAVAGGGGEAGDGEEQLAQGQLSNVDEPQLAQAMEPQVQQLAPNGLFGPQQRLEWNDEGGPNLQRLVRGRGNLAVNRLGQRGGGGGMAPGEAIHEPFRPPLTAAKVQRGIQDAVLFLRSMQAPDGSIGEGSYAAGGNTALAVLAMLAAGGDPAADRSLQQALDWLLELEADNTYVRAIRANVWEYALRKVPYHERLRTALEQDFQWLRRALGDRDGWRYSLESTDWDNSCTQYGVLGMWAAARAGHDPGDGFWQRMSRHFRKTQNRDGGWGYVGSSGSSANMATAGLASMFLVFDMYHGKSYYQADQPRTFSAGEAAEVLASLERGMKWLGASSSAEKANSYYLYGIERAGVASGRKYIGGEDWFASGALTVLTAQQPDGSIQLGYGPVISTAFSTLFLVYGGAPVAFNKLEHGKGQDWNLNPRDLANLSKYLWVAYERPLSWHSVSIDAEAGELEAPVLFLSGSKALQLNDGQVAKLRGYVRGGGTILAEPSDHAAAFRTSALELLARLFPPDRHPTVRLQQLPPEHGVYTVIKQQWRGPLPRLLGASDGSRTFFFLSEEYLAADWQRNDVESDAFKLALNLLFYATDLGTLDGRFASVLPETPAARERRGGPSVASLRRESGGKAAAGDWDAAQASWPRLADYLEHTTGLSLEQRGPLTAQEARSQKGLTLLHLSGREDFVFTEAEQEALKAYVGRGGTLLVDAWGGAERFAAAARRELSRTFGALQPLDPASPLASGRFPGGADLSTGVRYKLPVRRILRRQGASVQAQHLEVVPIDGRPAVIFSPYDLSGAAAGVEIFRCAGYKPESARKVLANVLAWLGREQG